MSKEQQDKITIRLTGPAIVKLKTASAITGKSIGEIVEESLDLFVSKQPPEARKVIESAGKLVEKQS